MSDLIERYTRWLRAAGRAKKTIASRERLLNHASRHLPRGLDDVHPQELAEYLADPTWSVWTRHTYHVHLATYYQWAYESGHFDWNPMCGIPCPPEGDRLPNPAKAAQIHIVLTKAPPMPWRRAGFLACYAGLRCCEIVSVRREDCDERDLRIRGKGNKVRLVGMAPQLWAEIQDAPLGLLVTGVRGAPISAQDLTQRQRAVWRKLGLPDDFRLHRMRHAYATGMVEGGADEWTVMDSLGHASPRATRGYVMISDPRRQAAAHRLPNWGHEPGSSRLVPPATEAA